jgi:hypothetical protein
MYTHKWFPMPAVIYALCLLGLSLTLQSCNPPVEEEDTTVRPTPREPSCLTPSCEKVPPPPASSQQHALVIGINKYQYASPNLTNLKGAVNDARLLRDTLRQLGVSLPDERVLLNDNATVAAFQIAWQNLLTKAKPGDTLIITYSGHGGQHTDTYPLGESDNRDESLLFHNFNPQQPTQGHMTDDELYGLLKKARDYNIVLLVDACHSSGMVRSEAKPSGSIRFGGFWDIQPEVPSPPSVPNEQRLQEDDNQPLPHVTLITAVEYDKFLVSETTINGQWHGALSWYFAQALKGNADGNRNGFLERTELARFLQEKVHHEMNYMQTPKLVPAQEMSVIRLPQLAPELPSSLTNIPNISVFVENASAPSSLKYVRFAKSPQAVDLRFIVNTQETEIFNNTGDKVATLRSNSKHWQPVINKARLLKALAMQFDMRLKPIQITLGEGDGLHKGGETLHIDIKPGDQRLNALTLFNLAGNGKLQLLYPLSYHNKVVRDFPYTYKVKVAPPYGGEHLIAVLCEKPATDLHKLLADSEPKIPEPEKILSQLRKDDNRCQVGQHAFFSSE